MKKILLSLALLLLPSVAWAQCTGVFPANTLCGNLSGSPAPPSAFTASTVAGPGSSTVNDLAAYGNTSGSLLIDTGILYTNIPTLNGTNSFTGTNTFNPQLGVPSGGTGNATATAHSLPINEGTSAQANTGTGTQGQCVVSNGAADPSFISGCRVLLATLTASNSATLQDTTHITSTYNDYEFVLENIIAVTNDVTFEVRIHTGGAFPATTYSSWAICVSGATANTYNHGTFIGLYEDLEVASTQPGISGTFRLYNPASTTTYKIIGGTLFGNGGDFLTAAATCNSSGFYSGATTAVDGIQFLMSSGNISSGSIKIYGLL